MKVSGKEPEFQELYGLVYDTQSYDALAALKPPTDVDAFAARALGLLASGVTSWSSNGRVLLDKAFAAGGCVREASEHVCKALQKRLAAVGPTSTNPRDIVALLQDPTRMDQAQFVKVIASPKVIDRAARLGIRRANLVAIAESGSFSSSVVAAARRAIRKRRHSPEPAEA
jgi:hypothetical protein